MKLDLFHAKNRSAIIANDTIIEYSSKTHKYRSENDFKTITTELNTYGEKAAQAVIDYLVSARAS